jgi:hypothetical protein
MERAKGGEGTEKRRSVPQEDTIAPPRTYCMVEITRVRLVVLNEILRIIRVLELPKVNTRWAKVGRG